METCVVHTESSEPIFWGRDSMLDSPKHKRYSQTMKGPNSLYFLPRQDSIHLRHQRIPN